MKPSRLLFLADARPISAPTIEPTAPNPPARRVASTMSTDRPYPSTIEYVKVTSRALCSGLWRLRTHNARRANVNFRRLQNPVLLAFSAGLERGSPSGISLSLCEDET